MKNYQVILGIVVILAITAIMVTYILTQASSQADTASVSTGSPVAKSCLSASTAPWNGVVLYTLRGVSGPGEIVGICLLNMTDTTYRLRTDIPWRIVTEAGQAVYTPVGNAVITYLKPNSGLDWKWNSKNNSGQLVPAGHYRVVVDELLVKVASNTEKPEALSALFSIKALADHTTISPFTLEGAVNIPNSTTTPSSCFPNCPF